MMSPRSDALLRELRSRNVAHTLNKSGELVLGRKLPADLVELLPTEMIPSSVLRWHSEYKEGLMSKELLGAPRYHSRVAALRRYHLIAPVARKTPQQKKAEARAYLQRWRREHRLPTAAMKQQQRLLSSLSVHASANTVAAV